MKQIHGYRKGECDPRNGQQLTICGREVFQIDRHLVHIQGEEQYGRDKVTCSSCLARLVIQHDNIRPIIAAHRSCGRP